MKLYDVVLIVSSTMLGLQVCAQTNFQDNTSHSSGTNESQVILVTNWVAPSSYIRVVNGTVCDVTTSPQWVWITIPYGSSVELPKRFQFNGSVQLMTVTFRIISQTAGSTSMDYVTITNYPYDPRKFASDGRYGGIKTKETLRLCLFPTQSPQPYWDALGNMKVSRVRDFEYGLPYTEKIPVVKQARMIGGKMVMLEDLRAVKWLQEKAANGDESAQCSLGLRYLKGQGVPKDAKRAREWLGKAAAQGNAEASAALSKLNATPMDSLNVKSEAK